MMNVNKVSRALNILNLLYQKALFEVGVASAFKTLGYYRDEALHMRMAFKYRCIALIEHDRVLAGR
jgi:hypothetical protein